MIVLKINLKRKKVNCKFRLPFGRSKQFKSFETQGIVEVNSNLNKRLFR